MKQNENEIFSDVEIEKEYSTITNEFIVQNYEELCESSFLNINDGDWFYEDKDELRFK